MREKRQRNRELCADRVAGLTYRELGERYGLRHSAARVIVHRRALRDVSFRNALRLAGMWPPARPPGDGDPMIYRRELEPDVRQLEVARARLATIRQASDLVALFDWPAPLRQLLQDAVRAAEAELEREERIAVTGCDRRGVREVQVAEWLDDAWPVPTSAAWSSLLPHLIADEAFSGSNSVDPESEGGTE